MDSQEVDYIFLAPGPNMFYLTGIRTVPDERLQVLAVPREGSPILILPEMYGEAAGRSQAWFNLVTWCDGLDLSTLIASAVGPLKRAAVDKKLWAGHFLTLINVLGECRFVEADDIMGSVRVTKDDFELESLGRSANLADKAMAQAAEKIRPGMTEKELALLIENTLKSFGAEDISFKPIIASGPNGSLPHHSPQERELQRGDFVVMDFGAVAEGYCSDITRTFFIGRADAASRELYRVVQQANETGFQAASMGAPCERVDAAARAVIAGAGYGRNFIHRTGHGIGLDYHEDPYIVQGNAAPLQPGMVFSIEPGIYLQGKLGIRIEDIVAVTESGPVRLNQFPRELIEIT